MDSLIVSELIIRIPSTICGCTSSRTCVHREWC